MASQRVEAAFAYGNLMTFSPGMSAEEKGSILNVITVADMAASNTYDRDEFWSVWMHVYTQRLAAYGLQRTSFITPESRVLGHPDDWADELFQIVGSYGSGQLAQMVRRCFSAARLNRTVSAFFDHSAVAGKGRYLQLAPCEKTAAGEVVVLMCGVYLSFNTDAVHVGGKRVILHVKGGRYVLDRDVNQRRRDELARYLDNRLEHVLTRALV